MSKKPNNNNQKPEVVKVEAKVETTEVKTTEVEEVVETPVEEIKEEPKEDPVKVKDPKKPVKTDKPIKVDIETMGVKVVAADEPADDSPEYTLLAGRTRWLRPREFEEYSKICDDRDVDWTADINPENTNEMCIIIGHYNTLPEAYSARKTFTATKGIICSVF